MSAIKTSMAIVVPTIRPSVKASENIAMKSITFSLALLVVSLSAVSVQGVALTWDNGGGNQLWSTGTNWNPDQAGAPAAIDTITFNNTGTEVTAGTATNIVTSSLTIASLHYASTANFHTTEINSGQTLTVNGGHFMVGQGGAAVGTQTASVTIKGDSPGMGTLSFNNPSFDFVVGRAITAFSGTQNSTLNMSGLGTFNMNGRNLDVARINPSGSATLNLAASNNITVDNVRAGWWNNAGTIRLGQSNIINANAIQLAWQVENAGTGNMLFNTGLAANPTVTIRNKAGSGRADLSIGWATNGAATGHLDLSGGIADALLGTVTLGGIRTATTCCSGNSAGTITLAAGTIDATTMIVGRSNNNPNALSTGTGTVHVNGGTLIAGEIRLAEVQGPSAAVGTLNINGGSVLATAINSGSSTGVGAATRTLNFTSGTLSHKTGTDLTVSSAINFRLQGSATKSIYADASQSVIINANIQNFGPAPVGGITKTGAGTLLLNGSNSYTGATQVNAGTVGGVGAAGSDFVFANGSTLSPGVSDPGTFLTDDATLQSGSTFFVQLGGLTAGTEYDQLLAASDVIIDGNLVIEFIDGFAPNFSDVFVIVDADSVTGTFSSITMLNSPGYFNVVYNGTQVLLTNFTIPEPATLHLLGLAGLLLVAKRRRKQIA